MTLQKEKMARRVTSYNWEETNAELIALFDSQAIAMLHVASLNILGDDTLQHLLENIFKLTTDDEKVSCPDTDDDRVVRLWTYVQECKQCPRLLDEGCEILTNALGYTVTLGPATRPPLEETRQAIVRLFSLASTRNLNTTSDQLLTPWLSQFIGEVYQDMEIVAEWRDTDQDDMVILAFLHSLDAHQTKADKPYENLSWKESLVTLITMWLYH
jgi:hypothetical protein